MILDMDGVEIVQVEWYYGVGCSNNEAESFAVQYAL